jgi:hypothetical protein
LITDNRAAAVQFADTHPMQFAHAVGRSRDRSLRRVLSTLAKEHYTDLEFASMCVWAFGCLGAARELAALVRLVRKKFSSPIGTTY